MSVKGYFRRLVRRTPREVKTTVKEAGPPVLKAVVTIIMGYVVGKDKPK